MLWLQSPQGRKWGREDGCEVRESKDKLDGDGLEPGSVLRVASLDILQKQVPVVTEIQDPQGTGGDKGGSGQR